MEILITGGAGYIGSVRVLLDDGHQVGTMDNLSAGFRDAGLGGEFIQARLRDKIALDDLFGAHHFDAAVHFAGSIAVAVIDPLTKDRIWENQS